MGESFKMLSPVEQEAVAAYARAECERFLKHSKESFLAVHIKADPAAWQQKLCDRIAQDKGQVRVILENAGERQADFIHKELSGACSS